MEELIQILRHHAKTYPAMEPVDAVKLLYQNEFGGGHLVANEAAFRQWLWREYEDTPKEPAALKQEAIGNGIVRVYLASLTKEEVERLAQDFLESARRHKGNLTSFVEKLSILRQQTELGLFSFDLAALDAFLSAYRNAGYPMVSHSETYRTAYRPAYRVICK